MLSFLHIMTAVKYPNQWAVIKLCVKSELKGNYIYIKIYYIYKIIVIITLQSGRFLL